MMRDIDTEYLIDARILLENWIAPERIVSEAEAGAKSELTELSGRRLSFDDLPHEFEELAARCIARQWRLAFLARSDRRAHGDNKGGENDDRPDQAIPPTK